MMYRTVFYICAKKYASVRIFKKLIIVISLETIRTGEIQTG
jgi:hypothetical protein